VPTARILHPTKAQRRPCVKLCPTGWQDQKPACHDRTLQAVLPVQRAQSWQSDRRGCRSWATDQSSDRRRTSTDPTGCGRRLAPLFGERERPQSEPPVGHRRRPCSAQSTPASYRTPRSRFSGHCHNRSVRPAKALRAGLPGSRQGLPFGSSADAHRVPLPVRHRQLPRHEAAHYEVLRLQTGKCPRRKKPVFSPLSPLRITNSTSSYLANTRGPVAIREAQSASPSSAGRGHPVDAGRAIRSKWASLRMAIAARTTSKEDEMAAYRGLPTARTLPHRALLFAPAEWVVRRTRGICRENHAKEVEGRRRRVQADVQPSPHGACGS